MIGVGTSLLFDRRAGKAGPPIPPFNKAMVDAWFMSGLSNADKPGSITGVMGNEMALKNFTYSLSSGFGKYEIDFNSWIKNVNAANFTNSDSVIHLTEILVADSKFLQTSVDATISSYQVKVEGITDDIKLRYVSYAEDGTGTYTYLKNGINDLPISYKKFTGFAASVVGSCNITITQLPTAYEGGLVFDGVDDYGMCTGLPIMDDFTLICKREILNTSPGYVANKGLGNAGAFHFESSILTSDSNSTTGVWSYGTGNRVKLEESEVSWMTKNSYNGIELKTGNLSDVDQLYLCRFSSSYTKAAIYYFALYNKSLTIEEIETEKERLNEEWKRRLNKEEPAWYTEALICEYNPIRQGCTNQNMNADHVLRDLSGNGYHMDCYNFAWNTQSGIYDDGSLILDGVDDYLKVTGLPIMDDFTVMVQSYDYVSNPSVLASKAYPTATDGAFILRIVDTVGRGSLRSFGNPRWVTYVQETVNVMAMTKTECYKDFDNNVNFYITPGTGVDSDTLWIGKIRDNNSVFGKTRLYSFLMFNRSLTKKEMDWVRNNKMN